MSDEAPPGRYVSVAALTPRVRAFVVCDEAFASGIEVDVHTLENARDRLTAPSYPHQHELCVFLLLSDYRGGTYHGSVRFRIRDTEEVTERVDFVASFEDDMPLLAMYVEMGPCVFPAPGWYDCQVVFRGPTGDAVIKGEQPFLAIQEE